MATLAQFIAVLFAFDELASRRAGPDVLIIDFAVPGPKDGTQNLVDSAKEQHGEFEAAILTIDATGATRNFYKGVIS